MNGPAMSTETGLNVRKRDSGSRTLSGSAAPPTMPAEEPLTEAFIGVVFYGRVMITGFDPRPPAAPTGNPRHFFCDQSAAEQGDRFHPPTSEWLGDHERLFGAARARSPGPAGTPGAPGPAGR